MKGKTASTLSLSERRQRAFDLYTEGYNIADVARRLRVTRDTAARYKATFEARIQEQATANPRLLTETLANTFRALEENQLIRREAWKQYKEASVDRLIPCPHCEEDVEVPAAAHTSLQGYLNTLIKAQEQRSKLFQLFGVKADYFLMVNNVRIVQDKLLEFMRINLCPTDRAKLEEFMTQELGEFLGDMPVAVEPGVLEAASTEIA